MLRRIGVPAHWAARKLEATETLEPTTVTDAPTSLTQTAGVPFPRRASPEALCCLGARRPRSSARVAGGSLLPRRASRARAQLLADVRDLRTDNGQVSRGLRHRCQGRHPSGRRRQPRRLPARRSEVFSNGTTSGRFGSFLDARGDFFWPLLDSRRGHILEIASPSSVASKR